MATIVPMEAVNGALRMGARLATSSEHATHRNKQKYHRVFSEVKSLSYTKHLLHHKTAEIDEE